MNFGIFVEASLFQRATPVDITMTGSIHSNKKTFELKNEVEYEEVAPPRDEVLERYEKIRDKSAEELVAIEKSLVRKLDWKFLPMVSAMLMMK